MTDRVWTDPMVSMLRTEWEAGITTLQIARNVTAAFGVLITKNAVVGKADRIGLSRPSQVKRLDRAEYVPVPRGRNVPTLPPLPSPTVKRLPPDRRKTTDADEAKIRELRANGLGYKTIAQRTKFSTDVVRRVAGNLGYQATHKPAKETPPMQIVDVQQVTLTLFRPLPKRPCQFPMWGHHEKPVFRDDVPWLCGDGAEDGVYCRRHAAVCYNQRSVAA